MLFQFTKFYLQSFCQNDCKMVPILHSSLYLRSLQVNSATSPKRQNLFPNLCTWAALICFRQRECGRITCLSKTRPKVVLYILSQQLSLKISPPISLFPSLSRPYHLRESKSGVACWRRREPTWNTARLSHQLRPIPTNQLSDHSWHMFCFCVYGVLWMHGEKNGKMMQG